MKVCSIRSVIYSFVSCFIRGVFYKIKTGLASLPVSCKVPYALEPMVLTIVFLRSGDSFKPIICLLVFFW